MKKILLTLFIFISMISFCQPYKYSYELNTNFSRPYLILYMENEKTNIKDYVEFYVDDYEKVINYAKEIKDKALEYDSIYDANNLTEKIDKYFNSVKCGIKQSVEARYINDNKKSKIILYIRTQTTNYTYVTNDYKCVRLRFDKLDEIDKFIDFFDKEKIINEFNNKKQTQNLFD